MKVRELARAGGVTLGPSGTTPERVCGILIAIRIADARCTFAQRHKGRKHV